jgi:RimJ/RimL family protein N-acetyltransferase
VLQRLDTVLERAKAIIQAEGWVALFRRGGAFLFNRLLHYGIYYLYELKVEERHQAELRPRIQDFTFEIVPTTQRADELLARGFRFRSSKGIERERLDKGAVAFCIFIGKELAHIGWVAMNEEARNSIARLPIRIDFSGNEAFLGGVWTNPKYRGMGLMTYSAQKRVQFLTEKGIIIVRNAIATGNIAPQKAIAKIGFNCYARARYLRFLWLTFWKEKRLMRVN